MAGSGVVIGATTIVIKSMLDIDGNSLTMSTDFGTIAYATIDPGNNTLEEQISFSGLTNNSNGTTTLSGVKTVLFESPWTETSGLAKTHSGSAPFVISNTSGFYNAFGKKASDESVTGYWTVPDPVGMTGVANKEYVLSVVNGGTVSVDKVIPTATAGETIATGNIVYLKSDGFWWLAKANDTTKIFNVQLGIAQGAGTAGVAITGGVLIEGQDTNQSGLTTGTTYYVSNTGTVSATAGDTARIIGQGGQAATKLYFNPNYNFLSPNDIFFDALAGENLTVGNTAFIKSTDKKLYKTDAADLTLMNVAGIVTATVSSGSTGTIRLNGKVSIGGLTTGSRYYLGSVTGGITSTLPSNVTNVGVALSPTFLELDRYLTKRTVSFTTPGANTWTKRPGLKFIEVECQGAGGGSGGCTNTFQANGGGGGGGYSYGRLYPNTLSGTVTVTVGTAGAAGAGTGGDGGTGGTSSFGALIQATGGTGGAGNGVSGVGGVGGVGSGGDVNINGNDGGTGFTTGATAILCGYGGGSHLGGGPTGPYSTSTAAAVAGKLYGGGAAAGGNGSGSGDVPGALGAVGLVLVTEFY